MGTDRLGRDRIMGSVFEFTPTTITLALVVLLWLNMARPSAYQ